MITINHLLSQQPTSLLQLDPPSPIRECVQYAWTQWNQGKGRPFLLQNVLTLSISNVSHLMWDMGIRFALFAEQNGKKFLFRMLHLMSPLTPLGDIWSGILQRLSSSRQNGTVRQSSPRYNITEPAIFDDDDESLNHKLQLLTMSMMWIIALKIQWRSQHILKFQLFQTQTLIKTLLYWFTSRLPLISTAVTGAMLNLQLRPLVLLLVLS